MIEIFRYHENPLIETRPLLFFPLLFYFHFIRKRLGQIYNARLRINCSSLNQHLFSKNLIDNPLCICGSVENTYHYLLTCNRFSNLRQELFNKVSTICRPTLNVLLYDNDELSMEQNKIIFFWLSKTIC